MQIQGRLRNREIDRLEFKQIWETVNNVVVKQMGEMEDEDEEVVVEEQSMK
jgi:hypothetical protein